jgi:hypothetical protein
MPRKRDDEQAKPPLRTAMEDLRTLPKDVTGLSAAELVRRDPDCILIGRYPDEEADDA